VNVLASLTESIHGALGRGNGRAAKTELSMRVPSNRFHTRAAGWETAPVNLVIAGARCLPVRPETGATRWVEAVRSDADCELVLSSGTHRIAAREVDDRDKAPVLREDAKRGAHGTRGWRRLGDSELRWIGREIAVFEVERP